MEKGSEQIVGMILYCAISPDYTLRTVVFTDRRVLEIPLSKMSELVSRTSQLPSVAAWLLEVGNPFVFSGLGSLVGLKMWKNLKKRVEGQKVVVSASGSLPPEIAYLAVRELLYEKINAVKIKKVALSNDSYLGLSAGFIHSKNIVFDSGAEEDVRNMLEKTPLGPKISIS
jgi:hypothetical protein